MENFTYIVVDWQSYATQTPTRMYHELNEGRFEQRRVEIFRDGTSQWIDSNCVNGDRMPALEPLPPIDVINSYSGFTASEITMDAFEEVWIRATGDKPA